MNMLQTIVNQTLISKIHSMLNLTIQLILSMLLLHLFNKAFHKLRIQ